MINIIEAPTTPILSGDGCVVGFESDLFTVDFCKIIFDFTTQQPAVGDAFRFYINEQYFELPVVLTLAGQYDVIHYTAPMNAYILAFVNCLKEIPDFKDYRIEVDSSMIVMSKYNQEDFNYRTNIGTAFDLTNNTMTFHQRTSLSNHKVEVAIYDAQNDDYITSIDAALKRGKAYIDLSNFGESLIDKIPPNIDNSPTLMSSYKAMLRLSYNEIHSATVRSRMKQSGSYTIFKGYTPIELDAPTISAHYMMQGTQERIIGRAHHDWLMLYFPIARTVYCYIFQYDNTNTSTKTELNRFDVAAGSIWAIPTGTSQLSIAATTVRYNFQLGFDYNTAFFGVSYDIDDNWYFNDFELMYPNRKGGFDMMRAKGAAEFKTIVDAQSYNTTLVPGTNVRSERTRSERVSVMRYYTFNTGYVLNFEEIQAFIDVLGSEIYLLNESKTGWIPLIVETKDFSYTSQDDLYAMSFTAKNSLNDFN